MILSNPIFRIVSIQEYPGFSIFLTNFQTKIMNKYIGICFVQTISFVVNNILLYNQRYYNYNIKCYYNNASLFKKLLYKIENMIINNIFTLTNLKIAKYVIGIIIRIGNKLQYYISKPSNIFIDKIINIIGNIKPNINIKNNLSILIKIVRYLYIFMICL